jgi:hypothetical protein
MVQVTGNICSAAGLSRDIQTASEAVDIYINMLLRNHAHSACLNGLYTQP